MGISCELLHRDSEVDEPALEVADHFGDERFHWSNVNDLEVLDINPAILLPFLAEYLQDRQDGNVCFTSSGRSTDEQVLLRLEGRRVDGTLDPVKSSHV